MAAVSNSLRSHSFQNRDDNKPLITVNATPSSSIGCNKFRATHIWNELIVNLRKKVELKKHRIKMRLYHNCFSGSAAVDIIYNCLLNEDFNIQKEVSREKTVKLCQAFMDNNVFEAATRDTHTFDDSSHKYYKFLEDSHDSEESISDEDSKSDSIPTDPFNEYGQYKKSKSSLLFSVKKRLEQPRLRRIGSHRLKINPAFEPDQEEDCISIASTQSIGKGRIIQELLNMSGRKLSKIRSCEFKRYTMSPCSLFRRKSSPDMLEIGCSNLGNDLFSKVTGEVLREVALSRLLTIVELPVLDGLLCSSYKFNSYSSILGNANPTFPSSPEVAKKAADPWMVAALDLIEVIPKGSRILASQNMDAGVLFKKISLFQALSEYYSSIAEPLLPEGFTDLLVALLNLLMQEKNNVTIEAMQLMVVLLPTPAYEEFKRILSLMHAISEDTTISLDKDISNREVALNIFSGSIIRNKVLAAGQAKKIIDFMVEYNQDIFTLPREVKSNVRHRIQSLKSGFLEPIMEKNEKEDTDENTYCDRVSVSEYPTVTETETEKSLADLMNSVLDNTKIPLKEKRSRLKQFQKHHPDIFKSHFEEYLQDLG